MLRFVDLTHQSCVGRLFWCSSAETRDIERLCLVCILGSVSGDTEADAVGVIRTFKTLHWSRVPAANRNLPDNTGYYTPVYDRGDSVPWVPVAWEEDVPLDWYWGED